MGNTKKSKKIILLTSLVLVVSLIVSMIPAVWAKYSLQFEVGKFHLSIETFDKVNLEEIDKDLETDGEGNKLITSASEFVGAVELLKENNDGFASESFKLETNIEFPDDVIWGSEELPIADFAGTFDGGGHTISGLNFEGGGTQSMFKTVTGEIKNLYIDDVSAEMKGGNFAPIANTLDKVASVDNVQVSNVTVTSDSSSAFRASGLIECLNGDCSNSSVTNFTVKAQNVADVGGLAQYGANNDTNSGTIENCVVDGFTVEVTGYAQKVGGIIGSGENSTIYDFINCTVKDFKISAGSLTYVGGFSGRLHTNGERKNCDIINATITSEGSANNVAGFVGEIAANSASFTDCDVVNLTISAENTTYNVGGFSAYVVAGNPTFTTCSVSGTVKGGTEAVGGFIGSSWSKNDSLADRGNNTFINCRTNVDVSGKADVGGFIGSTMPSSGYENRTYKNIFSGCQSTGNVTSTAGRAGGFIGYTDNRSEITNCSATGTVSGVTATDQMFNLPDGYVYTLDETDGKYTISKSE